VTVKSSEPFAPLRVLRTPTSTELHVPDTVDPKTTSGTPSWFTSTTAGVIITLSESGRVRELVQDHFTTGVRGPCRGSNWQLAPEFGSG